MDLKTSLLELARIAIETGVTVEGLKAHRKSPFCSDAERMTLNSEIRKGNARRKAVDFAIDSLRGQLSNT